MRSLLIVILTAASALAGFGQSSVAPAAASAAEKELRSFYDGYADDLRRHNGSAVADRYDERGYFALGNGTKELVTFAAAKERYTKRWTGPKSFEWRDFNFEALSADSAMAVGLFDWTGTGGDKITGSYTAVLTKRKGEWRIRVEDESFNTLGYSTKTTSGDRNTAGPWKYTLTAEPGTSFGAHKHTSEMKITVKGGRKFIIMGDLDSAKVQVYDAGSTFTIPANTWHVEWWETGTVEDIEIMAPTKTVRALPGSPRTPSIVRQQQ